MSVLTTAPSRRALGRVAAAVGVSSLGDWLALVPLALFVEHTTGSGYAVAALFIALWSPSVLLAGHAGLLADRLPAARVLVATSLAQAIVALVLAVTFDHSTAVLIGLVALLGCGQAIAQPAEFSLVAQVGAADVKLANGRVETARYLGFTAGPLLGGLLAAGGGTQAALLVNAASFLVVAALAAPLAAPRRTAPSDGAGPRPGDDGAETPPDPGRARDGLLVLRSSPVLAPVLAAACVSLLFMTATVTADVFFVIDVLGAGEAGYGALTAAWTVAMAFGAMVIARRVRTAALAGAVLVTIGVQGAGIAAPALWPVLGFAFLAAVIGGAAHGTKNVLVRTLIHEEVAEHLRGRAFAAFNGARNAAELVALLGGGLLVASLGPRATIVVAGAVPIVVALVARAVRRPSRTPDPRPPGPIPTIESIPNSNPNPNPRSSDAPA